MGFAQVSRTCFGRALHALLHLDDHYGVVNVEVPRSAPIDLTPVTTSQPSPPDPDETPSPAPLTPTSPPANNDTVWWIIILSLFLLFLLVVLVFICCIVRLRNENKKLQKTKSLQPTRYIEMTPQFPNSRGLSLSLPPSPMPLTSSDFDAKGIPPNFNDSANGLTAYTDSVNGLRETAGDSGLNPSNAPPSSVHSSLAGAAGATSLATSQTQSRPFTSTPMHLAADSASEVETSGLPSEQHFSTESLPPLNIAPVQTQGLVVNNQVVVTPRSTRNLHRQSLSDLDMQSVPQNYQMRPAVATPRSSRNLLAAQNGVPVTPISRNPRRPPIQVDDSLSSASPGVGLQPTTPISRNPRRPPIQVDDSLSSASPGVSLQPTTPSNRGLRRLLVQPDDVPGSVLGINQSFTPNSQSFTPSSQPFTPSNRGLRRLVIPDDGSNSTPFPATQSSRGLRRLVVSADDNMNLNAQVTTPTNRAIHRPFVASEDGTRSIQALQPMTPCGRNLRQVQYQQVAQLPQVPYQSRRNFAFDDAQNGGQGGVAGVQQGSAVQGHGLVQSDGAQRRFSPSLSSQGNAMNSSSRRF